MVDAIAVIAGDKKGIDVSVDHERPEPANPARPYQPGAGFGLVIFDADNRLAHFNAFLSSIIPDTDLLRPGLTISELVALLPQGLSARWAGTDLCRIGQSTWEHVDLLPNGRRILVRFEPIGGGWHALRIDLSELITWDPVARPPGGGVPVEGDARDEVLEALYKRADTAMCLYDASDHVLAFNDAYLAFWPEERGRIFKGYDYRQSLRSWMESDLSPAELVNIERHFDLGIKRHRQREGSYVYQRKDGRWMKAETFHLSDGRLLKLWTDVTRTSSRAAAVGPVSELVVAATTGFAHFDAEGRFVIANKKLDEFFPEAKILNRSGTTFFDFFSCWRDECFDPVEYGRLTALARRQPPVELVDAPIIFRHHDGRSLQFMERESEGGGFTALWLDVSDHTRRENEVRRAKEAAESANRAKSEFLANMSHELRTPLNAVIGFAELLNMQLFGPLGDRRYLDYSGNIASAGNHLLQIINDILDLSRIEAGAVQLHEEEIEAGLIVGAVLRIMKDRAERGGLTLHDDIAVPPPHLRVDPRILKQIVFNLLSNAIKFTLPGGTVTVSVTADGDGCVLAVTDTGIGIAAENITKALSPFGQVDGDLARKYEGTGLGLPLSQRLVELHGGRLSLNSVPDQGTTVQIWLPPDRVRWPAQKISVSQCGQATGDHLT